MTSEDGGREARLLQLQIEALGLDRREEITTSETAANSFYVPDDQLQSLRRNNKAGTTEAKAVNGNRDALFAWNGRHYTLRSTCTDAAQTPGRH